MAFVDEIKLHIRAGKGGDGVARWLNVKGKEYSGPAGGNGGNGGDVYMRAVRNSSILEKYKHSPELYAGNGNPGEDRSKTGRDGEDLIIDVPIGTYIKNTETEVEYELLEEGQQVRVLKGGRGGIGNEMFKGPINRTPTQCTPGKPGDEADFYIELRLIADYGLIGMPNAGKSTLLNILTNAKSKVGNYNFTTLEPHLGDMYGIVIADIPGLIEGASEGKGLGHTFLRHIERTKMLLHCITAESQTIKEDYQTIRNELRAFNPDLVLKKEIVLITKSDMFESEQQKIDIMNQFPECDVLFVSILDDVSVEELKQVLRARI